MRDHEELLRKHQEEFNQIRQKLNQFAKKDGGNLNTRDFTDDIYTMNIDVNNFVESVGTQSFTNALVVIGKGKIQQFYQEQSSIMTDYYQYIDA